MNRQMRRLLQRQLKRLHKKMHAQLKVDIQAIEVIKADGTVVKYGGNNDN